VCAVLPLASASGAAVIGVAVIAACLFLIWLLRMEREGAAEEDAAGEQADRDS
jgi:hypothetical protein